MRTCGAQSFPHKVVRGTYLDPRLGKGNLNLVRDETINSRARLEGILGKNFLGVVAPDNPDYRLVRQEVLGQVSMVLSLLPLVGDDGPKGVRTFNASPMYFGREEAHLLRKIGEDIHPDIFAPADLRRLIGKKRELYKFEVRVPSAMLGFNLDGSGNDEVVALDFTC